MAIPEWLNISKTSGEAGSTQVEITAKENTGVAREATLQITSGTKTVDYKVSQKAANRYVINIKPATIGEEIPTDEDLSDFAYDVYHISNSTDVWELSSVDNLISDLEIWGVSHIYVNWSPFDGQNICDYNCLMESSGSSIGDCFNPNASDIMARLVLNGSLQTQRQRYQYNLRDAAFHQGSPILEITVERNSTKLRIYTLSAYQNDITGDRVSMHIQTAAASGMTISCKDAVIYTNTSGRTWKSDDITMAGALNMAAMEPQEDTGIMRVVLTHPIAIATPYRWRTIKWFVDGSNKLRTFTVRGTMESYNPLNSMQNSRNIVQSNWSGTTGTPTGEVAIDNTDLFYNPIES